LKKKTQESLKKMQKKIIQKNEQRKAQSPTTKKGTKPNNKEKQPAAISRISQKNYLFLHFYILDFSIQCTKQVEKFFF
jgi:hypothetical protein